MKRNSVGSLLLTIQESCNGGSNTLKHYLFDPYGPTQTFIIKGN
jgi:hypothetical protein